METRYLTCGGEKGVRRGEEQRLGYRTSSFPVDGRLSPAAGFN